MVTIRWLGGFYAQDRVQGCRDDVGETTFEHAGLHLEGEDLAALGFAANPTILAIMELNAVA